MPRVDAIFIFANIFAQMLLNIRLAKHLRALNTFAHFTRFRIMLGSMDGRAIVCVVHVP